jgi:hypothetical protein
MVRKSQGRPRANDGNWRGRLAAGTSVLGMTVLMGLLVFAPSASAGSGSHTFTAPYKSAKAVLSDPNTTAGGGSGTQVQKATWNKTSGIAGFSSTASATWWSNRTNSSANREGEIVLSISIHVKTTGTHNLSVIWETVAAGYANLTAGTCGAGTGFYSSCTRSANVFVYGSASLLDKKTKVSVASTNKWPGNHTYLSNYTSCVYTSCSSTTQGKATGTLHTGAAFWAFYFNGTKLNATHNYTLKMTLFGGARIILDTTGGATLTGASGNAQFNSATLGNEEYLYSYTVA